MEAYFPVVSKIKSKAKGRAEAPCTLPKDQLGLGRNDLSDSTASSLRADSNRITSKSKETTIALSSAEITSGLLATLSDVSNPITHSNIYERSVHIVSCSTGHQVSEGRKHHSAYMTSRTNKLQAQRQNENDKSDTDIGILKNTRIYIGGYLENSTDIEMKRLVVQAGGQIVSSASQCTHIITSRGLSASKTDRLLTRKAKNNVYVVKPEWVLDSIGIGKRRSERTYAIVKASNTLQTFFKNP